MSKESIDFSDYDAPGLFDIPEPEYHRIDAAGSTKLKAAITSSKQYIWERDRERDEDKYRMGTLFHQAVLEPDRFQDEWIPDARPPERPGDKAWKDKHLELAAYLAEGRDWDWIIENHSSGYAKSTYSRYTNNDGFADLVDFYSEHEFDPDQKSVSSSELKKLYCMMRSVFSHEKVKNGLLSGGETEKTILTPFDGINAKGRFDFISNDRDYYVDLKMTRKIPALDNRGVRDWSMELASLGYHYQLAYYGLLASEVLTTFPYAVILVCQHQPPFHCRAITLERKHFDKTLPRVREGVERIKKAEESGFSLEHFKSVPADVLEDPDIHDIHDRLKSEGSDDLGLPSGIHPANLRNYHF